MRTPDFEKLRADARAARRLVLTMVARAKGSHTASSLSVIDLLVFLYGAVLPVDLIKSHAPNRDRFILSKGWAAAGLYSVLAQQGIIQSREELQRGYCADGTPYVGITTLSGVPGIEATTGSMGHGLPISVGMALAGKKARLGFRVFTLISDGELDEGSTWEAIAFSAHHRLDNLTLMIDYNQWQSFGATKEVLDMEPIADKFRAFRWSAQEINGHDFLDMEKVFSVLPLAQGKPSVIIAHTIKGKGVTFMENNNEWHYRTPNDAELQAALNELG